MLALVGLALLTPAASAQQAAPVLPPGFELRNTALGFQVGAGMAYAPDGRIFMAEKEGLISVAKADGSLPRTVVLDMRNRVNSLNDRGLLGIAVDKDFASNGYVYFVYVAELNPMRPDSDAAMTSRLSRITVSPDNKASDERVLLGAEGTKACPVPDNTLDCLPADHFWHTIGTVRVDPVDGTLWVGSGDSSPATASTMALTMRPLDERSLAGKIMHIDQRTGQGLPGHPMCPTETDLTKNCTKLYAKGFRNPFRFTLRAGKGPVVGDVGHMNEEELDLLKPGGNYGWPCYEGAIRTPGHEGQPECLALFSKEGTDDAAKPPAWRYAHGQQGGSITAGPVYTGARYPAEYRGDILVGDFSRRWIKRLDVSSTDVVTAVHDFGTEIGRPTDMQIDPNGNLAFADVYGGGVKHIAYANVAPTARASASPASGAAPLAVTLTGDTSTDPDGDALAYDWDFGDGTPHATTANPSHTYQRAGEYTARLTVADPAGNRDTATVVINVGTAPVPTIAAPTASLLYSGGTPVALKGSATDAEDGAVPGTALKWEIKLHHGTHAHTFATLSGADATFTPVTDHDADSYYEIRLVATDTDGLSASRTVTIRPQTYLFGLSSSPPGAPVSYGGRSAAAPFSQLSAVGYRGPVSAADQFVSGGRTYRFARWSDGGARSHDVTVPARASGLVAIYEEVGTQAVVISPSADTGVRSDMPAYNGGQASSLHVDGSPARMAYLRFPLSALAGKSIVRARVLMHPIDAAATTGGSFYKTLTDTWSEGSTTYDTRPAHSTTALGQFGRMKVAEWAQADLAAGSVPGTGALSLALVSANADGTLLRSREGVEKPLLVVETRPATETLTFRPSADADVSPGSPDKNFGADDVMVVDGSPTWNAYLRFPVTGLAGRPVLSAKLRMFQKDQSSNGGEISKVSSNAWTESGITWNTRPAIDGPRVGGFGAVATTSLWYEAAMAAGAVTGDGDHSFALTSPSGDGAYWASRNSTQPPELIVTVENR